jgi:tRNA(His) 5'-end guanylyltransferase
MKKPYQLLGLPKPKSEASGGPLSLKDYEVYSGIEIPEKPLFVRLDGWNFHTLTKKLNFKKPFDPFLAQALRNAALEVFKAWPAQLCYIFSDEINFLFLSTPGWRRVEKIDSILASFFSTAFLSELRKRHKYIKTVAFDCRCIPLIGKNPKKLILDYLVWRQAECFRNCINAWAQYLLQTKEGLSARTAAKKLEGLKAKQLLNLIKKYGIDLKSKARIDRDGLLLYKRAIQKFGYNPIQKKKVRVLRNVVDFGVAPKFNTLSGKRFLSKILNFNNFN